MVMSNDDLLKSLKQAGAKQRPYANFFWWHDRSPGGRSIAECGAAKDLFTALGEAGLGAYRQPRPSGEVWPDCIADRADGQIVAIEVTELVDSEVLEGRASPRPWTATRLVDAIQNRVTEKDKRAFHGGRYAEVLLLIHTDEDYLQPVETIELIKNTSFRLTHGNLDRAFLLFSYWPALKACPVAELALTR